MDGRVNAWVGELHSILRTCNTGNQLDTRGKVVLFTSKVIDQREWNGWEPFWGKGTGWRNESVEDEAAFGFLLSAFFFWMEIGTKRLLTFRKSARLHLRDDKHLWHALPLTV